MELSYGELRCKEIVNTNNGARMGKPIDIIFDADARNVLGLVAAGERRLFKPVEDIFIPWDNITKIGSDVILICLEIDKASVICRPTKAKKDNHCCQNEQDYL